MTRYRIGLGDTVPGKKLASGLVSLKRALITSILHCLIPLVALSLAFHGQAVRVIGALLERVKEDGEISKLPR